MSSWATFLPSGNIIQSILAYIYPTIRQGLLPPKLPQISQSDLCSSAVRRLLPSKTTDPDFFFLGGGGGGEGGEGGCRGGGNP